MKVLCIGNTNYDITIPVASYPVENKKVRLSNDIIECGGGSASNVAFLLSSWGVDTTLASLVGNDYYGKIIKDELVNINVNIRYLESIDSKTAISYILANRKNGSRTVFISRDKNIAMHSLKKIREEYDFIFLDGGYADIANEKVLKSPDSISILDAGTLNENTLKLANICSYIVCSSDFAQEFTNINLLESNFDNIKKCYEILANSFKGQIVITLEKFGSFTKINGDYKLIPSISVKAVDSTGAGDIYHGAFVYFLSLGYDLEKVMRLSNIAGALSVTKIGGRNSIPTLKEVISYVE